MQPTRLGCPAKRHQAIGRIRLEGAKAWAGRYIQLPHRAQTVMPNRRIGSSHSAARDRAQPIHKSLILACMAGKQMNRVKLVARQQGPGSAPVGKTGRGDRLAPDQHLTWLAMGNQSKGVKSRRRGQCRLQNLQGILIGLDDKGHHTRVEPRHENVQISQTCVDQEQGVAWHQ